MVKVEREKIKRVGKCLEGDDNDLNIYNQQLDEALKQNGEWRELWEKKFEISKRNERRVGSKNPGSYKVS